MSLLKDTETGVRGCMFLQDMIYLQPFYQAKTILVFEVDYVQKIQNDRA